MTDNYSIIKKSLTSKTSMQMFTDVFGSPTQAKSYIASALLAVRNSDALMKCAPGSIAVSALRAATLRLSCDPGIGQAYLVPFGGKATLVIGYKGLKDLAIRTGKYRFINIATVKDGMVVEEDFLTGVHRVHGAAKSQKPIGYLLYFELVNGFSKTFYMSVEEIHAHAAQYSKSYNRGDSPWKTNPAQMEKKTVMRLGLTRWGYFDPSDVTAMQTLDESDPDDNTIDGMVWETDDEEPAEEKRSEAETLAQLGFGN